MPSSDATIRLHRDHAAYPRRLGAMPRAPEWLALRGRIPEHERAVAIVGPRAASAEHCAMAREFARFLVERQVLVVSGGALGVDAAAHDGAVDAARRATNARGGTLAVLGCGVDVVYPERNGPLFQDICALGGGLLSPFADGAPPRSWHFVRRNQIMAAMCDLVLVIGAGARSGALHTARAAREFGRIVAAVPGTPGCQALLASGAAVVRDTADLERALHGEPCQEGATQPEEHSDGARVLSSLDPEDARDIDDIAKATGLPVRTIQCALTDLELEGLITLEPGHRYLRSYLADGNKDSART